MAATKAQELYFERVKKIRSEMTRIERELDAHTKKASTSHHWGHAGDLGRVLKELQEISLR